MPTQACLSPTHYYAFVKFAAKELQATLVATASHPSATTADDSEQFTALNSPVSGAFAGKRPTRQQATHLAAVANRYPPPLPRVQQEGLFPYQGIGTTWSMSQLSSF
jgi:hypothetical protein